MLTNSKHIWEGWTVGDFINELEPIFTMIQNGKSYVKPFKERVDIKHWCISEQPYYKKYIPEVVDYFYSKI